MYSSRKSFHLLFKKLGSLVTEKDLDAGRIYPPIASIHEVTVKIAVHLSEHLYKNKKAWNYPGRFHIFLFLYNFIYYLEPKNKEEFIRMQLYDTSYEYFGPLTWQWPEAHNKPRNIPSIDDNIALDS